MPRSRSLAQKLDAMLLQEAKISTRSVGGAALKSAVGAAKLGKEDADAPANVLGAVQGYELPLDNDVARKASRQTRSFFVRDLLGRVTKKGWFN